MLEPVWFLIFTIAGMVCCYIQSRWTDGDGFVCQLLTHAALVMSIAISWDVIGGPLYHWFLNNLPQAGTDINRFTSVALLGVLAIAHVVGLPLVLFLVFERRSLKQNSESCTTSLN